MTAPIAFVTFEKFPNLTPDDRKAVEALAAHDIHVQPVLWDDDETDWSAFAAVVLRSTWDYHQRMEEFLAWIDHLDAAGVPVWNPTQILRWNMDKRYLQELEAKGVATTPTRWLSEGGDLNLVELMDAEGWTRVVVKPVVSAGADDTFLVSANEAAERQAHFAALLSKADLMVQPYMEEVSSAGEWSFLFFDRRFSHAVLKQPAQGDFRVQIHHGGRERGAAASDDLISQAAAILNEIEEPLLYGRVDAIERDGRLILMELELLEPSLFFNYDEGAARRFADTMINYLGSNGSQ